MRRTLITGGCGFIGSNFIGYCNHKASDLFNEIINLDALTYASNKEISRSDIVNLKYGFEYANIQSYDQIRQHLEHYPIIDTVVHFAAESHVDNSIKDAEQFILTNINGTFNLLEFFRRYWDNHSVPNAKFIYISTDEVYGTIKDGIADENYPLKPNNPYSASKLGAEALARSYNKTYGMPIIITRCCNNFGPHQHREKFIPVIINSVLKKEPIPIYGNGEQVRNWIYVEDHCSAIVEIIKYGVTGRVYNIGTNVLMSNIELAKIINEYINPEVDLITHVQDRLGHDTRYAINSEFIRQDIRWIPKFDDLTSVRGAIYDTIEWYKNNK